MADESFLVGTLVVSAVRRTDGKPLAGQAIHVDASCTGCCCGTWVRTDRSGTARVEVPIGKITVKYNDERCEAWIALDQETFVEFAD
ncbi:MAG: hypothetical protein L0Y44_13595 [Phycisphaerales bacterium]|nr:hypothetical protein [Phycisphaerales bacterium]MCI0677024.1 hypothetical protein [Phycisphaerales bacterium]